MEPAGVAKRPGYWITRIRDINVLGRVESRNSKGKFFKICRIF